jgi:hypothetical protein
VVAAYKTIYGTTILASPQLKIAITVWAMPESNGDIPKRDTKASRNDNIIEKESKEIIMAAPANHSTEANNFAAIAKKMERETETADRNNRPKQINRWA